MVFVGRRACLTPEDLLARLAVVFDLAGLLFVFLFFGMEAVYHCGRPVVGGVSDKLMSRGTLVVIHCGLHSFRSLAFQMHRKKLDLEAFTFRRAQRLLLIGQRPFASGDS